MRHVATIAGCRAPGARLRQPASSATSEFDSTRPRNTAEAMKGLPSARLTTCCTTASGSGPAIDSSSRRMSVPSNFVSLSCRSGRIARNGESAATSSLRKATSSAVCPRWAFLSAFASAQRVISFWADSSTHWQSSRMIRTGRARSPRASKRWSSARRSALHRTPPDHEPPPRPSRAMMPGGEARHRSLLVALPSGRESARPTLAQRPPWRGCRRDTPSRT